MTSPPVVTVSTTVTSSSMNTPTSGLCLHMYVCTLIANGCIHTRYQELIIYIYVEESILPTYTPVETHSVKL